MDHLEKGITLGYLISCTDDKVYVLVDNKKTIERYSRSFWKAYHEEENF